MSTYEVIRFGSEKEEKSGILEGLKFMTNIFVIFTKKKQNFFA